ncbi:uncharacterized protein LOC116832200 isoform X3 [Chelonoidis abingdonii]|uniref:uncharacterized protein LOC116832200 isoform X3 n=1 Tax=Chelonoidis abingdonii TaxID=106734 RepID=UPI003F4941F3
MADLKGKTGFQKRHRPGRIFAGSFQGATPCFCKIRGYDHDDPLPEEVVVSLPENMRIVTAKEEGDLHDDSFSCWNM